MPPTRSHSQPSFRKAKQFERIQDRDDERRMGRVATYVVVKTLIRFTQQVARNQEKVYFVSHKCAGRV
jgi:hypothetical protein